MACCFFLMGVVRGFFCFFVLGGAVVLGTSVGERGVLRVCMLFAWLELLQM